MVTLAYSIDPVCCKVRPQRLLQRAVTFHLVHLKSISYSVLYFTCIGIIVSFVIDVCEMPYDGIAYSQI